MKKSLIALAVLAASGAAMAQSSVTLYGVVDLNVGRESTTTYPMGMATKVNNTRMSSGGLNGSRWGLRGTEDLGGGLNAIFVVESGFDADTGAGSGGPNRRTVVGLSGGFGTVTLGNEYSAMDDMAGANNTGFDSAFSASNKVLAVNHGNGHVGGYVGRPKNAIKYVSPNFSGFTGAFSYALDEAAGVKKDQVDFRVSYATGPVTANFAYEVQGDKVFPDDLKVTALNGSYDLGMVKLKASVGQSKITNKKSNDVQLGVDVPLSSAVTLSAGFAQSKDKVGNVDGDKRTGFGLAATYDMSKRTTAYAGMRSNKTKNSADVKTLSGNLVAVGLRHRF